MVGTLKKYIFTILSITAYVVINFNTASFAIDKEGCLICHQYPGLIRLMKPDEFRVLHIDEGKYCKSPHGEFECRKCHKQVEKVPHTGETEIDCTTECHIDDKAEITAIDLSSYIVHKDEKYSITILRNESSCRVCHPLYPHSENKLIRAFINMHAGFMFCEVCHLKKEHLEDLTYDWKNTEGVEFSGEPFGTYYKYEVGVIQKSKNLISRILRIFFPEEKLPWRIRDYEYSISRIAVFSIEKGEKRLLSNTWDTQKAIEFETRKKTLKPEEKDKELKYFHMDIVKKEISVACNDCHSPDSIIDYVKLGVDEKKAEHLKSLNIKGLVSKYETFYFPQMLYR